MVHVLTRSGRANGKLVFCCCVSRCARNCEEICLYTVHLCYCSQDSQHWDKGPFSRYASRSYGLMAVYLQVCAQERLPLGVLIVVSHQQVEQSRRLSPQIPQLGDAALEHLTAQSLAQRHPAFKQHRRELKGHGVSALKTDWGQGLD